MQLYINCITAEKIMTCKKDLDVNQYMKLINPQSIGGMILFDVVIHLPDDFNICTKHVGIEEIVIISLSRLGNIELNTKDFRDLTLY